MKRGIRTSLIVALVGVMILSVITCAKPAPTMPVPAPAPTPTPVKPHIIKYGSDAAAGIPWEIANTGIFMEAEKRSGGRLKMEYYQKSLITITESVRQTREGLVDVCAVANAFHIGTLPLSSVVTLPALSEHAWPTLMAYRELAKMPELVAELDAQGLIMFGPLCSLSRGVMINKRVTTLADLKGKKIAVPGGYLPDLVKALGAVPLTIQAEEIGQSLQAGTVDGTMAHIAMTKAYGYVDMVHYYYALPTGNIAMTLAFNKDSWKKVPDDIKKLLNSLQDWWTEYYYQQYEAPCYDWLKGWVDAKKLEVTYPSDADVATMQGIARQTVWSQWVKQMNDKGLPGQKVLDKWLELYAKYAAQDPHKGDYKVK